MASPCALVIGESLVDVIPPDVHPGGSPMNVAIGLARLGHETWLGTWYATDDYGQTIVRHLQASGVHVVAGSDDATRTSSAQVIFDEQGSARYLFDLECDMPDLPPGLKPLVAHAGSLGAVLRPSGPRVLDAIGRLRGGGCVISFDPNTRPDAMGPVGQARALVESYVRLAHVVKASDEDIAWLYPGADPLDVARQWSGDGPSLVVLTMGARGSHGFSGPVEVEAGPPAVTVADTVGAGDAFMSGLLHALWISGWLGRPQLMDAPALGAALSVATAAAGVALSRAGADPPWLAELA